MKTRMEGMRTTRRVRNLRMGDDPWSLVQSVVVKDTTIAAVLI